jgi:hypothetical protein
VNIGVPAAFADSGAVRSARVPILKTAESFRRVLAQFRRTGRALPALQPPGDHGCLQRATRLVIAPFPIDKPAREGQLIRSALVLAQNLHRLVRRWCAFAVELSQPFLARRHRRSRSFLFGLLAAYYLPDWQRTAPNGESSARDCGFSVVSSGTLHPLATSLLRGRFEMRLGMMGRFVVTICVVALCVPGGQIANAQDVPGIEICTAEKAMERRTSCLQSNIEFLQKTIAKLDLEHRQKLDAAKAQIEALKANIAVLQKAAGDLQAIQQKMADESKKKADGPPAKEAGPPKDAVKDGAKENAK